MYNAESQKKKFGVKIIFAWYDLWIGAFFDRQKKKLYILPFPMIGVVIQLPMMVEDKFSITMEVGSTFNFDDNSQL